MTISTIKLDNLHQAMLEYNEELYENTYITRVKFIDDIKAYINRYNPIWEKYQLLYDKQSLNWTAWINKGKEYIIECPEFDNIIQQRETSKTRIHNWRIMYNGTGHYVQSQTDKRCHWNNIHKNAISAKTAWKFMLVKMDNTISNIDPIAFPEIRASFTPNINANIYHKTIMFNDGILIYHWDTDTSKVLINEEDVDDYVSSLIQSIYLHNKASIT